MFKKPAPVFFYNIAIDIACALGAIGFYTLLYSVLFTAIFLPPLLPILFLITGPVVTFLAVALLAGGVYLINRAVFSKKETESRNLVLIIISSLICILLSSIGIYLFSSYSFSLLLIAGPLMALVLSAVALILILIFGYVNHQARKKQIVKGDTDLYKNLNSLKELNFTESANLSQAYEVILTEDLLRLPVPSPSPIIQQSKDCSSLQTELAPSASQIKMKGSPSASPCRSPADFSIIISPSPILPIASQVIDPNFTTPPSKHFQSAVLSAEDASPLSDLTKSGHLQSSDLRISSGEVKVSISPMAMFPSQPLSDSPDLLSTPELKNNGAEKLILKGFQVGKRCCSAHASMISTIKSYVRGKKDIISSFELNADTSHSPVKEKFKSPLPKSPDLLKTPSPRPLAASAILSASSGLLASPVMQLSGLPSSERLLATTEPPGLFASPKSMVPKFSPDAADSEDLLASPLPQSPGLLTTPTRRCYEIISDRKEVIEDNDKLVHHISQLRSEMNKDDFLSALNEFFDAVYERKAPNFSSAF